MVKKNTIVINLFSGPCVGKSTTAAMVFAKLKMHDVDCEMALEFAKEKVWEESYKTMDDQIHIFGKQLHKIWRLNGKVDVIICDSPLPFSIVYDKEDSIPFHALVMEQFDKFNNRNFYIRRGTDYNENGRVQTLEEAIAIDNKVKEVLDGYAVPYTVINVDDASDVIVNSILDEINRNGHS